jgi:hypothetical protein
MCSVAYGFGHHSFYITAENLELANRFLFMGRPPWAWSVALVKISMALMLLRFKHSTRWRIFLYSMIGLQVAIAIGVNCSQFLMCRPLAALWDPATPNVRCWTPIATEASVCTSAVLGILTDVTFATLPITFIRHLNRRLWERALICCLMGLGIFASIASIVRTTLIPYYGKKGDDLWDAVDITLWSTLEQQIGLIAACVPPLKRPFETLLRHYGVLSATGSSSGSSGHVYQKDGQNFELVRISTKPNLRMAIVSDISTINEEEVPDVQDLEGGIDKKGDV